MSGESHKKGYQFPDLNTPGDPRILDAIQRRTPQAAGMGVTHTPGGVIHTPKREPRKAPDCRFKVAFANNRLRVGPGSVAIGAGGGSGQQIRPFTPTLDGKQITEWPYWDVSSKENNQRYNIWCVYSIYYEHAKMVLLSEEDELELEDTFESKENAKLIAWVRFLGDDRKHLKDFSQEWGSDIFWIRADDNTDSISDSNDSSDEDSEDPDNPDSSGDSSENSSDNSEDSSDDSSSGGCSFPALIGIDAALTAVDGSSDVSCLMEDETNSYVLRPVTVSVNVELSDCLCDDCAGWVDLVVQVGPRTVRTPVGSCGLGSDLIYAVDVSFNAFPCSEYPVRAKLIALSSGSFADECPLSGSSPSIETTITMPGVCSNAGACP